MNGMRRSLIGLGIAGVPLAVFGRNFLLRAQEGAAGGTDPLLAYLLDDTKRNCRLAVRPGRERAKALRGLGANVEVLSAYLLARQPAASLAAAVDRRACDEGVEALARSVREAWPAQAETMTALYGASLPADLDYTWVTTAIEQARKRGFPNARSLRRALEREADRVDQLEGQVAVVTPVRQTPGNDYGPPGWNAGIGDPPPINCYDLGIFIAVLACLSVVVPELASVLAGIGAGAGLYYAVVCNG